MISPYEEARRMCSILKDSLKYHREMLDYWKRKCYWPDMTMVHSMMYSLHASVHEETIPRLENSF